MNRKQAKEFYPILQAYAEGKVIERRTRTWELNKGWQYSTNWEKTEELKFQDTYEYRIKQEPKYRPFKDAKECWQEMQKHQPFAWVKEKHSDRYSLITEVNGLSIKVKEGCLFTDGVKYYTFADGTPFGIKEEEQLWKQKI